MNLIESTNYALEMKTFSNGLHRYTQKNCQVTLTDDGYHIYRTPNAAPSTSGNTMWGGFILRPFNIRADIFEKGHTYVFLFNVRGISYGAATDVYWSFNAGNGVAATGLAPNPSNVQYFNPVSANFNTDKWQTFYYKWEIQDDVYKVNQYNGPSGFVSGNTYPSYRDFKFGWAYKDTGPEGTDIYIKNLRLYDITNMRNMDITKTGIAEYVAMIETSGQNITSVFRFGEIRADNFYET